MGIKREDLDAGRIDLEWVTTGKRMPPTHPGKILRADFLVPIGVSVYGLATRPKLGAW